MRRLVEELPGSFEAQLLTSEQGAEPSSEAQARALQSALHGMLVGTATATGTAAGTAAGAAGKVGGAAWTAKLVPGLAGKIWVVGVVLSSAAGTGAVLVAKSTRHDAVAPSASNFAMPAPSAAPFSPKLPVESKRLVVPASEPSASPSHGEHADRNARPLAQVNGPPPRPSLKENDLAGEIQTIDRARAALARHDPNQAIAILGEFDRQYPSASLSREAALLRVEALAERGDRAEAIRRAKDLIAQAPEGPYQTRLRRILELENSP